MTSQYLSRKLIQVYEMYVLLKLTQNSANDCTNKKNKYYIKIRNENINLSFLLQKGV